MYRHVRDVSFDNTLLTVVSVGSMGALWSRPQFQPPFSSLPWVTLHLFRSAHCTTAVQGAWHMCRHVRDVFFDDTHLTVVSVGSMGAL